MMFELRVFKSKLVFNIYEIEYYGMSIVYELILVNEETIFLKIMQQKNIFFLKC